MHGTTRGGQDRGWALKTPPDGVFDDPAHLKSVVLLAPLTVLHNDRDSMCYGRVQTIIKPPTERGAACLVDHIGQLRLHGSRAEPVHAVLLAFCNVFCQHTLIVQASGCTQRGAQIAPFVKFGPTAGSYKQKQALPVVRQLQATHMRMW